MGRTTVTCTVSLPPEMADELERVRTKEQRTRSELVREALRQYFRQRPEEAIARMAEAQDRPSVGW